jgi:hypothetical protein
MAGASVISKQLADLHDALQGKQLCTDSCRRSTNVNLSDKNRIKILNWLSEILYLTHYKQIERDVLAGTGEWFFETKEFNHWYRSSTSSILWLNGIRRISLCEVFCPPRC